MVLAFITCYKHVLFSCFIIMTATRVSFNLPLLHKNNYLFTDGDQIVSLLNLVHHTRVLQITECLCK